MLLILKIIKIFKKCYHSVVVMWQHMSSVPVMRTVWRLELELTFISSLYGIPERNSTKNTLWLLRCAAYFKNRFPVTYKVHFEISFSRTLTI
jgi:hypothetical protein